MLRIAFDLSPLCGRLTGVGWYTKLLMQTFLGSPRFSADWRCPLTSSRLWRRWHMHHMRRHLAPHTVPLDFRWRPGGEVLGLRRPLALPNAGYDLFHLTQPQCRFRPGKVPMVVTAHDLAWQRLPQSIYPAPRLVGLERLPDTLRAARIVLCDSKVTMDDVAEFAGVPRDRLVHVPLAARPGFHPPTDDAQRARAREEFTNGQHYFLAVSTIEPRKNYPRLIEAFAQLVRRDDSRRLVLVGQRGSGWPAVEEALRKTGIESHVDLVGYVDDSSLLRYLWGADALLMPSLYEGFGLPVLEAMACGTPVVTAHAGSLPEVAADAAILVDPLDVDSIADGLTTIAENENTIDDLRSRGYAQAARYSWQRTAEATWQAYHRAIGREAPGSNSCSVR